MRNRRYDTYDTLRQALRQKKMFIIQGVKRKCRKCRIVFTKICPKILLSCPAKIKIFSQLLTTLTTKLMFSQLNQQVKPIIRMSYPVVMSYLKKEVPDA